MPCLFSVHLHRQCCLFPSTSILKGPCICPHYPTTPAIHNPTLATPPVPPATPGQTRRDANVGLVYDEVDWKVWTHPDGDSFSRFWVRLQETREACNIIEQLLGGIPAGPIMAKVPRIIKVPAGEAYVATENPLGEMGFYVVSQGDLTPFRVKIRSASFSNMSITPWLLKGVFVPDIISILASLYFCLLYTSDAADE